MTQQYENDHERSDTMGLDQRAVAFGPARVAVGDNPSPGIGLKAVAPTKPEADRPPDAESLGANTLRPDDLQPSSSLGFRLLVIGESQHTAHRLPRQGDVTLGRSDAADIVVPDPLMSRIHAVLHVGAHLSVTDRGSSNGTLVRGDRIPAHQPVQISVGDTIEVGSTVLIVQPEFSRVTLEGPAERPGPERGAPAGEEPMERIYKLARRVAASNINVLLLGETGVGKEVLAQAIHSFSERASRPFLGLNCASLAENLFESELFGYERGAFTGAQQSKPGLIETAEGGTVFLDELGEMPLSSQAKLLRVIEDRKVMRVGSLRAREIDVRFIAATHQNLEGRVAEGRFREDLFYRLNGISLVIPPLRDRPTELLALARTFIAETCRHSGVAVAPVLSSEAVEWMRSHPWPGNIRELKNAVHRAVLLANGGTILPEHLRLQAYSPRSGRAVVTGDAPVGGISDAQAGDNSRSAPGGPMDERERIVAALAACGGNQTRAAKMLGIARRTLTSRLGRFNLPRPRKDRGIPEE